MPPTSSIAETGVSPDLFLMQAIRHGRESGALAPPEVEQLFADLTRLASEAMDGLVLRSASPDPRQEAVGVVMRRASLALEGAAEGDLGRAAKAIAGRPVSHLLHTGNAIHARLIDRVEAVRHDLALTSALPTALSVLDEIDLANTIEHVFLDELAAGRIAADEAQPRLERLVRPRRMASLSDYAMAAEMLDRLAARRGVFDLLPPELLFAHGYPTDELGDTARIILCRLFVCVLERGGPHMAFDPTPEEVDSCGTRLDRPEALRALAAWIDRFASALPSDTREFATGYLHVCRTSLRAALPQLLD